MLNTELKNIPLWKFTEILRGNIDGIVIIDKNYDQKTKMDAAINLLDRYYEVTGRLSVTDELQKCNRALSCLMATKSIEICRHLVRLRKYGEVCDVLKELGYKGTETKKHECIPALLEDIEHKNKTEYALLLRRRGRPSLSTQYPDYFDDDTPIICERFKVDSVDDWSAEKYANHVKILCDELAN